MHDEPNSSSARIPPTETALSESAESESAESESAESESAEAVVNERLQAELDFLFGRINYERTTTALYPRHFKLESMRRLLGELGNPQNQYAIIHVAGTKGKGSVCGMIAAVLNQAGILTGVYSSPHIESLNERMTVGGTMINDADLADVLSTVRIAVEKLDRLADQNGSRNNSFFEMVTAAALLHFARARCRKVALEVGLGGRLDSTNVCEPELCVITNISLDHQKQLGDTVDLIAREKAGIIKQGVPVVSGVLDPLAQPEIREASAVQNVDLVELGRDFHVSIRPAQPGVNQIGFDTHGHFPERHSYLLKNVQLNGCGHHNVRNAAVAVAALNMLPERLEISQTNVRNALATFSMMGRVEVLSRKPLVVADMAHNPASAKALVAALGNLAPKKRISEGGVSKPGHQPSADPVEVPKQRQNAAPRVLLFAGSRDKDIRQMLTILLPVFNRVVFTRFVKNPRAADPKQLRQLADQLVDSGQVPKMDHRPMVQSNPVAAWDLARQWVHHDSNDALLCVAGSAFLLAEIRPLVKVGQANK